MFKNVKSIDIILDEVKLMAEEKVLNDQEIARREKLAKYVELVRC